MLMIGLLVAGCASTAVVVPVDEVTTKRKAGRGGIVYYLPKTMVSVTVPVKRTGIKEGKYRKFSELFLGIRADAAKSEYEVGKPTFSIFGKRDDRQDYYVKIPGGPFTANTLNLEMTSDGVFTKGISDQENKTVDFIVSTVEVTAKIASTVIKAMSAGDDEQQKRAAAQIAGVSKETTEFGLKTEAKIDGLKEPEKTNEFAKLDDPDNQDHQKWVEWQEFEKKYAEMSDAAERVKSLSESRDQYLLKNAPFEDVKQIEQEIAKAASIFLGEKVETTWGARFEIEPSDFTWNGEVPPKNPAKLKEAFSLFRVVAKGPSAGVTGVQSEVTPDLPDDFRPKVEGGDAELVQLTLSGERPKSVSALEWQYALNKTKSFRYRIPTEATVAVVAGAKVYGSDKLQIAQYGSIGFVPTSTGSMQTKWDVTLNGSTGALEKITLNNKNFDPAMIGKVGDAANGVVQAGLDRKSLQLQRAHDNLKNEAEMVGYRETLSGKKPAAQ